MRRSLIVVVAGLLMLVASASVNQSFDGIWVGAEIMTPQLVSWYPRTPKPEPERTEITIAIAQGGTLVGIIGGICSGRFQHVWWTGNSLNFDAHNCKRNVSLSSDGKTLIEKGSVAQVLGTWVAASGNGRMQAIRNSLLSGTFHRK
jgi:hypothetical protein